MANLGTLWFGADIDLQTLKQKIQSGNQSILDALKMNYDPASYQQMINKLRTELSKETFEIKVTTNAAAVQQGLRNTLNTISNGATAPKIDLSGLKGIPGMTRDILEARDSIFTLSRSVGILKNQWKDMAKAYGENSKQALFAKKQYEEANSALLGMRYILSGTIKDRGMARLAQQELNKQTREAARATREWNSDHMRLNATLAGGIHVSTQLGSALSSLFAIDAARQFLGYVIEIGGQLEKQRISIGAILGDTVKANHLFEQIKGLALKSPFGVVELDQYTKQLSAYGFKYNELFDMTKRLADISAGAGTDIGRLTLALGHVRSATYLTGITLRQFSMNNIPMLKMLADYYSEVEKKAVSTAEVQQRISKRQVSYEDVIEQIRRLTDEGGMFFNMQEKISESLAAKYKNLKDAMDIMYGEMAEGAVGDALKGLASTLLGLTRHWKEIANVMAVAAGAFLISKIRIGMQTVVMQGNTAATVKQIMANKQLSANNLAAAATYRTLTAQEKIAIMSANSLTVADLKLALATKQLNKSDILRLVSLKQLKIAQAMHLVGVNEITAAEIRAAAAANKWKVALAGVGMSLKNAFAGIGFGTFATFGAMVGMGLYSAWDQWNQRIDDKSKEMKDLIKSRINDLQKLQKTIDSEGKPNDQTALKNRIDDMKQVLANSEEYTKTLDEQLSKAGSLSEQYDILAKNISEVTEKNRKMLDYQELSADLIKASSTGGEKGFFESLIWGKEGSLFRILFNDDIKENMEQTLDAYKDLRTVIDTAWEYKEAIKGVIEEMSASGEITKEFAEQLKSAPFEEQIRLLAESKYWDQIVGKILSTNIEFINLSDKLKEAADDVTEKWDEIANDDIPKMFKRISESRGEQEEDTKRWALANIDDFRMMLDSILNQLDINEPEVRRRLKRMFYYYARFGQMAKNFAAGPQADEYVFGDEFLQRLFNEEQSATIKEPGGTSPTKGGEKKDKQLEAARTRLQEYKSFLSEYKKYRKAYSKEEAIDILENLFPDLKGQGADLVDNYIDKLDELRNSLKLTTEKRKKWATEVDKTKADTKLDREMETIKRVTSEYELALKNLSKQWNVYKDLVNSTGNRSIAAKISGFAQTNMADAIREIIKGTTLEEDIDFSRVINMSDDEIEEYSKSLGLVGQKAEGVAKALKEWRDAQTDLRNEAIQTYGKMIADAGGFSTELNKINEQYDDQIRKLKELRDLSPDDPAKISPQEYENRVAQADLSKKINLAELIVNNIDFGELFELIGNSAIETAEEVKNEVERLISESNVKSLSQEELQKYIKLRNTLNNVGGQNAASPFSKMAWSELSTATSNFQATLKLVIDNFKDLIQAQEDEEQAVKDLENATDDEATKKAQQNLDDARTRKKIASDNIAQNKKNLKYQGQQLSEAQKRLIEGANSMVTSVQQIFSGSLSGLTTGILNMIATATGKGKGAAQTLGDALSAVGVGQVYAQIIAAVLEILDMLKDDAVGFFRDLLDGVFDAVKGLLDDIGSGELIGTIVGEVVSGIGKIVSSVAMLVYNIFNGSFFSGIWDSLSSAFNRDDERQELIEYSQKQVELLQKLNSTLEKRLERTLGGIYKLQADPKTLKDLREKLQEDIDRTFGSFRVTPFSQAAKNAVLDAEATKSYYDAAYANLVLQRDELQYQLDLEEDKKHSDSDLIKDYKQQIAEMEDQINSFAEDLAKSLYDIDIKSWASQLGDALFEAWQKGEDGAEAFAKKARELIADVTKNIISTSVIETALEPVLETLRSEMKDKNGRLDAESIGLFADKLAEVLSWLPDTVNKAYDEVDQRLQEAGLGSMKDNEESKSSSLSSSVKSVTENTADLLSSYINAIRADVSVMRTDQAVHLPAISIATQRISVLAETQVTHLQQIAANTLRNADAADRIYDIMHRIDVGVTKIKIS